MTVPWMSASTLYFEGMDRHRRDGLDDARFLVEFVEDVRLGGEEVLSSGDLAGEAVFEDGLVRGRDEAVGDSVGSVVHALGGFLVELLERVVGVDVVADDAVVVVSPALAVLTEEFLPAPCFAVDARDVGGEGFLSLAFPLFAKSVEALLSFEWESSEVLVGEVHRVDVAGLRGAEACTHPVGVEFLSAGAFDFEAELVVFGLGPGGHHEFACVLEADAETVALEVGALVEAA
ncbi:hypothetical protein [Haloferax sp. ATB1]|uniref:hypothetical protein n=1 Tax=Haloferax sp. ATB1 TaxID=1508454 RepID=UPI0018E2F935|nr:hypothetical protein [Haloferax sp. ATB1]